MRITYNLLSIEDLIIADEYHSDLGMGIYFDVSLSGPDARFNSIGRILANKEALRFLNDLERCIKLYQEGKCINYRHSYYDSYKRALNFHIFNYSFHKDGIIIDFNTLDAVERSYNSYIYTREKRIYNSSISKLLSTIKEAKSFYNEQAIKKYDEMKEKRIACIKNEAEAKINAIKQDRDDEIKKIETQIRTELETLKELITD